MEHLKKELWNELESAEEKVKISPGMMSIEDLYMIKTISKAYYYLCKIEKLKEDYEHEDKMYSAPVADQPKKGIY